MRRLMLIVMLAGLVLLTPLAQETAKQPEKVAVGYLFMVSPQNHQAFETALKEHIAFRKANGETWNWQMWQVATGEYAGQYLVRSFGHTWADMDAHDPIEIKLEQDFNQKVSPLLTGMQSSITLPMAKLVRWPDMTGMPNMVEVVQFHVIPAQMDNFMFLLHKIHAAIEKKDAPYHYMFYRFVSGGSSYTVGLVVPHDNWSSFAPHEPTMKKLLSDVYGEEEARRMSKMWSKAIRDEDNLILRYRPDLSLQLPK